MTDKRRRWPVRISLALSALFVLTSAGCSGCDGGGGNGNRGGGGNGETAPDIIDRCCNAGTPPGYLKIDDFNSQTLCGDTTDTTTLNACRYQLYAGKPVTTEMTICSGQPVPVGWEPVEDISHPGGTSWDPTKCGRPATNTPNMLKIKRTS